jgi:hypothetical protein
MLVPTGVNGFFPKDPWQNVTERRQTIFATPPPVAGFQSHSWYGRRVGPNHRLITKGSASEAGMGHFYQ